jgi:hypothetical protein
MWRHKKKYKGSLFFGNYKFSKKRKTRNKNGQRVLKFEYVTTGRDLPKEYGGHEEARKDGWISLGKKVA